jgi:hypothetical protein
MAIGDESNDTSRRDRRRKAAIAAVVWIALSTILGRMRGYKFGFSTPVRCRQGHLFTTIWIPGASVKSVKLGFRRFQRCPIGPHWSLVAPVKDRNLTEEQRRESREHRDVRIP